MYFCFYDLFYWANLDMDQLGDSIERMSFDCTLIHLPTLGGQSFILVPWDLLTSYCLQEQHYMGKPNFGCMVPLPDTIYLTPFHSLQSIFTLSPLGSTFFQWVHKVLSFPYPCTHFGSIWNNAPEVDVNKNKVRSIIWSIRIETIHKMQRMDGTKKSSTWEKYQT